MTEYYTIFNSLPFSMTLLPYAKLGDYHNASSGLCTTYNIYYSMVHKTTLHLKFSIYTMFFLHIT